MGGVIVAYNDKRCVVKVVVELDVAEPETEAVPDHNKFNRSRPSWFVMKNEIFDGRDFSIDAILDNQRAISAHFHMDDGAVTGASSL
jgi:hypothetical protein